MKPRNGKHTEKLGDTVRICRKTYVFKTEDNKHTHYGKGQYLSEIGDKGRGFTLSAENEKGNKTKCRSDKGTHTD